MDKPLSSKSPNSVDLPAVTPNIGLTPRSHSPHSPHSPHVKSKLNKPMIGAIINAKYQSY